MVEGKLNIWIKGGSFEFRNDLYVIVKADNRQVWKTDEKDSYKPQWDSKVTKHIKGGYEKLIFQLLDEDTFSRDDLLGTCEILFSTLEQTPVVGEIDMKDKDNKKIGHIDVSVEYEAGDVSQFDLAQSRIHDSDSD